MKLLIKQMLRESLIKEHSFGSDFNLPEIPKEIYDFIESEYKPRIDFDWNEMQSKLGPKMGEWLKKHNKEKIYNNLDFIISQISDDIETRKARKLSDEKLHAFEELIKPSLGKGVLTPALTNFQASVLMNPYASEDEIKKALADKSVLGPDGSVDVNKTEYSDYFKGGDINYPMFEKYVKKHPEFKKVFKDWLKLFKENTDLHTKSLKGFRGVASLDKLIKIREILVNFNKTKHMGDASLNEGLLSKGLIASLLMTAGLTWGQIKPEYKAKIDSISKIKTLTPQEKRAEINKIVQLNRDEISGKKRQDFLKTMAAAGFTDEEKYRKYLKKLSKQDDVPLDGLYTKKDTKNAEDDGTDLMDKMNVVKKACSVFKGDHCIYSDEDKSANAKKK